MDDNSMLSVTALGFENNFDLGNVVVIQLGVLCG